MNSAKPLDNFPLVRSGKMEETQNALGQLYATPRLALAHGFNNLDSAINNCQLRDVALSYCAFGAAVNLEFPAARYFVQLFPIQGTGEIICGETSVLLSLGRSATISQETSFKANYNADYQYLVLRINARALTDKLSALIGAPVMEPLRLALEQDFTRPAAQMLHRYIPILVDTLSAGQPPFPDWWVSDTERLLMTLFLSAHRHNYSDLLQQNATDPVPPEVRKAEQYIETNWQQAVTLDGLAEVIGISSFSLFRSFKRSRGYSPSDYLSWLRSQRMG